MHKSSSGTRDEDIREIKYWKNVFFCLALHKLQDLQKLAPAWGLGRENVGAGGFSILHRKSVSELILQRSQSWAWLATCLLDVPSFQHPLMFFGQVQHRLP